jgi:hypothetical protein
MYAALNYARINNPTYIALQNARSGSNGHGGYAENSWAAAMERRNALRPDSHANSRTGSSWWGSLTRSRSYRATSTRAPSVGETVSSVHTMTTAFSALKRFTGKGWNIGKSSVGWREGSGSRSTNSLITSNSGGSGGSGSGASTPLPPATGAAGVPGDTTLRAPNAPLGITNTKIRLYEREGSGWRDMGSARLTILPGGSNGNSTGPSSGSSSSGPSSPRQSLGATGGLAPASHRNSETGQGSPGVAARNPGSEKRIIVTAKPSRLQKLRAASSNPDHGDSIHPGSPNDTNSASTGKTLLDVTLGESCFERVARTGIGVSVWEDVRDEKGALRVGKEGGVAGVRVRMFMIQCKSEREAAWVFGLVGRLRY